MYIAVTKIGKARGVRLLLRPEKQTLKTKRMSKESKEVKNYTFEKPTGEMVCIEATSKKAAQAKFDKKYKAK